MICPHCHFENPADAVVCRECGSDRETGWSEASAVQRLGVPLPLDDESYAEIVHEIAPPRASRPALWRVLVALIAALGFVWLLVRALI